jgi:hypothetical protein
VKFRRVALLGSMGFMVLAWLVLSTVLAFILPVINGDTSSAGWALTMLGCLAWLLAPVQLVRYFRAWRALR